jgi:hypothetical protein
MCWFIFRSFFALWYKKNVSSGISKTNITIFTLLLILVDAFTLHMIPNPHIEFILLFILYILSYIWYACYIKYNMYNILYIHFFVYWMYIIPYNTPIILCVFHAYCHVFITFLNQGELTMSCRRLHQQIPKDPSPWYLGITWIQFKWMGKWLNYVYFPKNIKKS